MKCLNPKIISTRSKLLVPSFGEKLKREVRCGACFACQTTFQREWYYRAFYEYKDCVSRGGYMLMDCLTYDEDCVPKLSRFYPNLPPDLDYMCFDYFDFRYFMVNLRDYLSRKGYDIKGKLRYFAASEYGTRPDRTHRPHIHILFYCTCSELDNYSLSRAVSHVWKYGRTDGLPYKNRAYVSNYTIKGGLASSKRVCKYVSKYVMKSCAFQKTIDKRINKLLYYYYENKSFSYYRHGDWCFTVDYEYRKPVKVVSWKSFESFLRSSTAKRLKTDLLRYLNQFHRQSLGFGLSAINDFDLDSIIDSNVISIRDSQSIVMRIGLPNYYRRKLFYHLVEINGLKSWVLNSDSNSLLYKKKRDEDKLKLLIQNLELDKLEFNLDFDSSSLADYILNDRFTDKNRLFNEELSIIDKLSCPDLLFNYNTLSDFKKFHGTFISTVFLGNSNTDYIFDKKPTKELDVISFNDYINLNLYENQSFEYIIQLLREKKSAFHESLQRNYENRQRIHQIYKILQT